MEIGVSMHPPSWNPTQQLYQLKDPRLGCGTRGVHGRSPNKNAPEKAVDCFRAGF